MNFNFNFARIPEIVFGPGKFNDLAHYAKRFGHTVLVVTGSRSLQESGKLDWLKNAFNNEGLKMYLRSVKGEPSPEFVDTIVSELFEKSVDVVIAIGGGSVIDAGKAVSAMLGRKESVLDFLEGVGNKSHDGKKIPFIAIPTTAGTGSEATKNAVLSRVGQDGFKKSLRHNNFVPDIALIDPELALGCPSDVTAACGMDAFTQLLESYVSTNASPLTDALAYDGIKTLKDNLIPAATSGANDLGIRSAMSYASLLSGITLANAGLGIVHGLASPLGGYFNLPHGVACGTMVGSATRINIDMLRERKKRDSKTLNKYAEIGRLLSGNRCENIDYCCEYLVDQIDDWIATLRIPRLGEFGVKKEDMERIVAGVGNKCNPVELGEAEIKKIIVNRI